MTYFLNRITNRKILIYNILTSYNIRLGNLSGLKNYPMMGYLLFCYPNIKQLVDLCDIQNKQGRGRVLSAEAECFRDRDFSGYHKN